MQLIERRKTPEEMQAEYEKIQRIREQARLEERTHPQVKFQLMHVDKKILHGRFVVIASVADWAPSRSTNVRSELSFPRLFCLHFVLLLLKLLEAVLVCFVDYKTWLF